MSIVDPKFIRNLSKKLINQYRVIKLASSLSRKEWCLDFLFLNNELQQ
jgi:hypothetical protein